MSGFDCLAGLCAASLLGRKVVPRHAAMRCFGCLAGLLDRTPGPAPSAPAELHCEVEVLRLSGEQLCTLRIGQDCTIQVMKFEIQRATDIPISRQKLLHGSVMRPLEDIDVIGELADAAGRIALHLIQLAKPVIEPATELVKAPLALQHAIQAKDVGKSLALLAASDLASLNSIDNTHWCSVLHHAAYLGFAEVCEAILERSDFIQASALDFNGMTALHLAAHANHLACVHTLLLSKAFTAIDARAQFNSRASGLGYSARDLANMGGHSSIVRAIDAAMKS